jgi:hypothetical protein
MWEKASVGAWMETWVEAWIEAWIDKWKETGIDGRIGGDIVVSMGGRKGVGMSVPMGKGMVGVSTDRGIGRSMAGRRRVGVMGGGKGGGICMVGVSIGRDFGGGLVEVIGVDMGVGMGKGMD